MRSWPLTSTAGSGRLSGCTKHGLALMRMPRHCVRRGEPLREQTDQRIADLQTLTHLVGRYHTARAYCPPTSRRPCYVCVCVWPLASARYLRIASSDGPAARNTQRATDRILSTDEDMIVPEGCHWQLPALGRAWVSV